MVILKAIKRFRAVLKKEAEITAAQRRLAMLPMDYMALQTIADTVSSGYNVEITVVSKDGTTITIKRGSSQQQTNFKSFEELYNERHGK